MIKKISLAISLTMTIILGYTACDSGDIYPKEEEYEKIYVSISASFAFKNIDAFPDSYNILFVTYESKDDLVPLSYKEIAQPSADGIVNVSFPNLPEGTKGIGVWLTDKTSNKKMFSFYENNFEETPKEDIVLPAQDINLITFGRLQRQVFNQCIACHGGGASAAAGLYLTEGKTYEHIVNVQAKHNSAKMRIKPGSILNSYLIDVLKGEALAPMHGSLSSLKDDDVSLVEEWVENGAENK